MYVSELMIELSKLDQSKEILMASDEEGNNFLSVSDIEYLPDSGYEKEVYIIYPGIDVDIY